MFPLGCLKTFLNRILCGLLTIPSVPGVIGENLLVLYIKNSEWCSARSRETQIYLFRTIITFHNKIAIDRIS